MSDQLPELLGKEDRIGLPIDHDLAEKARQKAAKRGWSLSAVMRGLLTLWADEDVIDASDVGQASERVPHGLLANARRGVRRNMNSIELNRWGILLNFAAGFLLAPELIGVQRIRRFEAFLEQQSEKTRANLHVAITRIKNRSISDILENLDSSALKGNIAAQLIVRLDSFARVRRRRIYSRDSSQLELLMLALCVIGIVKRLIPLPPLPFFIVILFVVSSIMALKSGIDKRKIRTASRSRIAKFVICLLLFRTIPYVLMGIIAGATSNALFFSLFALQTLYLLLLSGVYFFVRMTSNQLGREDALRAFSVVIGVLCFIAGNLLQFWATF